MIAIDPNRRQIADPGQARSSFDRAIERGQDGITCFVRRNRDEERIGRAQVAPNCWVNLLGRCEHACVDVLTRECIRLLL